MSAITGASVHHAHRLCRSSRGRAWLPAVEEEWAERGREGAEEGGEEEEDGGVEVEEVVVVVVVVVLVVMVLVLLPPVMTGRTTALPLSAAVGCCPPRGLVLVGDMVLFFIVVF